MVIVDLKATPVHALVDHCLQLSLLVRRSKKLTMIGLAERHCSFAPGAQAWDE
jgi:hypothetical protein